MDCGFVVINGKAPFSGPLFLFTSQRSTEKGKRSCFAVSKALQFSSIHGNSCGHWHEKYEKKQEKKVDGWFLKRGRWVFNGFLKSFVDLHFSL